MFQTIIEANNLFEKARQKIWEDTKKEIENEKLNRLSVPEEAFMPEREEDEIL